MKDSKILLIAIAVLMVIGTSTVMASPGTFCERRCSQKFYPDVTGEKVAQLTLGGYKWRQQKTQPAPRVSIPQTRRPQQLQDNYRWAGKKQSSFAGTYGGRTYGQSGRRGFGGKGSKFKINRD